MTFLLGHAQKSEFLDEKVTYIFWLLFFNFFCTFPLSPFLIFLLQRLTFHWACFKFKKFWENITEMGKPSAVAGNFDPSFSLKFLSIFLLIFKAPMSWPLWPGYHDWKDLFLLQNLSRDDANFGQRRWHQKWNKGQYWSWPVTAGIGVIGLNLLLSGLNSDWQLHKSVVIH